MPIGDTDDRWAHMAYLAQAAHSLFPYQAYASGSRADARGVVPTLTRGSDSRKPRTVHCWTPRPLTLRHPTTPPARTVDGPPCYHPRFVAEGRQRQAGHRIGLPRRRRNGPRHVAVHRKARRWRSVQDHAQKAEARAPGGERVVDCATETHHHVTSIATRSLTFRPPHTNRGVLASRHGPRAPACSKSAVAHASRWWASADVHRPHVLTGVRVKVRGKRSAV